MQSTPDTLTENLRARSVELLNDHLAAAIDLHAQVKEAHWTVRGPSFIANHDNAHVRPATHIGRCRPQRGQSCASASESQ